MKKITAPSIPQSGKIVWLFFLLLLANSAFAKNTKVDSLRNALKTAKKDSNKVKILLKLSHGDFSHELEVKYTNEALKLSQSIHYKDGIATAYNRIGNLYNNVDDYSSALINYKAALKVYKENKDNLGMATAYGNIGDIYVSYGDYAQGLSNLLKALQIYKKHGSKRNMAISYISIGIIYYNIQDNEKALENYTSALKYMKEIKFKYGIIACYVNLGNIYTRQNNLAKALQTYQNALSIAKDGQYKKSISACLNDIGLIYETKKQYKKALQSYNDALKIKKEIKDKSGMSISYASIGNVKLKLKKDRLARIYYEKSLKLSKEIGKKNLIKMGYLDLSKTDSALKNYKSAYENYKMYILYRDSLKNKANTKKITQLQMQFKFDQQQTADSITHAKEKEIQQAKIAKQNAVIKAKQEQQYALFGGLVLLLIFAGFMYNRFRVTSKQKNIIEKQKAETEHQKQLLEVKNKEISDSINYAKRIQEAILPSRYSLSEGLKNGFVLFKPKDIVSGDFYWLEKVGDSTYFAAADCTGHGVPGAMVSVVCANALSKALLEENITEPGKLLDRTREIVVQQFSHSDENVKDGMDISLCKLTTDGAGGGLLQWSGANNPLWIMRKSVIASEEKQSQTDYSLTEIKPDKQPIGKTEKPKPFTTHNIELKQGDNIYIFSDGYADQFGGEAGKKFKYKPLKELLLSLQDKPMEAQKEAIGEAFEQWKGNEEQVDDVCVIGVRID